jgi:pilus assembly protein CpaE
MRLPGWPRAPRLGGGCWAFVGAVGGAGATTLAIEAAHALAARTRKLASIAIVDLNLADGSAAAILGVAPGLTHDAAPDLAGATAVGPKIDLLAWPRHPDAFALGAATAAPALLAAARERYDMVLVDLPRRREAFTLPVLSGCDEVVVVSELTTPALRAARAFSEELESALPGLAARIVLNRLAAKTSSAAPTMAQAEQVMQRKACAGVSSDWEAAATAANLGGAIAVRQPKSRIVRDVAALVDRLSADAEIGRRAA